MKKAMKILICFISVMIFWTSLSVESKADNFELPEDVNFFSYEGFLYQPIRKGENKGCVKIIYYTGKKKDVTVPKKLKAKR